MPPRKDQWRSPPHGWHERSAHHRCFHLLVYYSDSSANPWLPLRTPVARLLPIFGDHRVEVCTTRGGLTPDAWRSDLPWKERPYTCELVLPLSTLIQPGIWNPVFSSIASEFITVSAHRGGGASRHKVWSIDSDLHAPPVDRLQIRHICAARHVKESESARFQDFLVEFCRAATATPTVAYGYATVADALDPLFPKTPTDRCNWYPDFDVFENILFDAFRTGSLAVPGPRWFNLFSAAQVQRLGGIDHLRSAAAAINAAHATSNPIHAKMKPPPEVLLVVDLAGPALILTHPLCTSRVFGSTYSSDRDSSPPGVNALWLADQLRRARLLPELPDDWLDAYRREMDRRRARMEEFDHRYKAARRAAPPAPTFDPASITRAPRCIRTPAARLTSLPGNRKLAPNRAAFALSPAPEPGLAVYGVTAPNHQLLPPILIGSLQPSRAALYFDPALHGHDAELFGRDRTPARRNLSQLICRKCQGRLFRITAEFEYPTDLTAESEPGDPVRSRPQDFFSWFTLRAACASCGSTSTVTECECA